MSHQDPKVRASALAGFERFLNARGVDVVKLLRQSGLSLADIANPENQLSINSVMKLMHEAALATGDPCLGLSFAESFPAGGGGLWVYLFKNSRTVDEALSSAARFSGLLWQTTQVHYDKDGDGALIWHSWPDEITAPKSQYSSFALAALILRLRQFTTVSWQPEFVELPHEPLPCADKARRVFGPEIRYRSERASIRFDLATLNEKLPKADANLKSILQQIGEHTIEEYPASGDIVSATTAAIRAQLSERRASIELVASKLGFSVRRLQTALSGEGTTFEELLSDTRKQRAGELLKDPDLPMTEIAKTLGFSEVSSFTRAAQRWFGASPTAYRKKLRAGD